MNSKENKVPSAMIVAAEASSAQYALRLIEFWKNQNLNYNCFGVGTQEMEDLGFQRIGKAEEMAVVGVAEIVSQYSLLRKVFHQLIEVARDKRPNVVILMDYPEFNLMLAKQLYKLGIPVVYYISPQVWAWRKGRVKTIKKYCSEVYLLFPFEKEFYSKFQIPYQFVGHPVLDEISSDCINPQKVKESRRKAGINDSDVVLGLMPGSRRLELKQHFSIQLEVARRLFLKYPNLRVLILCAPTFNKEDLLPYLENFKIPYIIQKDDPVRMIRITDIVLVASGTATLMVALLEKPMVIMYKMKWLTGVFAKLFVRGVKYFGLVNLIAGREIVPERWQSGADPDVLTPLVERYLLDSSYKEQVLNDLKEIRKTLGDRGATERVAKNLSKYFQTM